MSTLLPFRNDGGLDNQFSKDGTALSKEERIARAKRKGLCSRCGISTHKIHFGRKTPLTNEHVYEGACIKCNPDEIPFKICVEWEQKFPEQIALAKQTQLHTHRGIHRQRATTSARQHAFQDPSTRTHKTDESASLRAAGGLQEEGQSRAMSRSSFSTHCDRCPSCGIQTHEKQVVKSQKRTSFSLKKKQKETKLVPLTIEDAVLAGRCLLCHPLPFKRTISDDNSSSGGSRTSDQKIPAAAMKSLLPPPQEEEEEAEDDPVLSTPQNNKEPAARNNIPAYRLPPPVKVVTVSTHSDEERDLGAGISQVQQRKSSLSVRSKEAQARQQQEEPSNSPRDETRPPLLPREQKPDVVARDPSAGIAAQALDPDADMDRLPSTRLSYNVSVELRKSSEPEEDRGDVQGLDNVEEEVPSAAPTKENTPNATPREEEDGVDQAEEAAGDVGGGVPQSIQIQPPSSPERHATTPPPARAAAAAATITLESGPHKPDDNANDLALATAVVLGSSFSPGEALEAAVPVDGSVPVEVTPTESPSKGEPSSENGPRQAEWPLPWPLNRTNDQEEQEDDDDSDDDDNDFKCDVDELDNTSLVSSLNFSAAEGTAPVIRQQSRRSLGMSSLREHSMAENSSLQRSARKLDGSSRTAVDASMSSHMDGMSNTQKTQGSDSRAFSASNSLMVEMLQTGDLLGWLQDFAAESRESDEFRAEAAEKGGIVAVISAMKQNKGEVNIQQQGCLALHSLANDFGATIAKQGGISCLMSAIKHHGQGNPLLQEYAAGALVHVVVNDSHKASVAKKGGIVAILAAMQRHINHVTVQQQSNAALLRVSSHKDIVEVLSHAKHKGIQTVVESMKRHKEDILVQQYGSGILKNIAQKETARSAIVKHGGVACLVGAINRHINNAILQQQACWALYEISASENIAKEGAIGASISAMEAHKDNPKVQQYGCGVLKHLSVTKENIKAVAKLRGLSTILDAMQNHVENAALQRCGCGALKHLSLSNTNEAVIANMGGISVVVQAMKEHKIDGTVQREACGALRNLSMNEDNKGKIAKDGGVVTILVAMKLNTHDVSLQQKACGALLNLSNNAELRRTIASYGGVIAVIAIMKHLASDAKVQQYACGTLKNLAVSAELKKTIAKNDGISGILSAMKKHSADPKLQSCACGALKNLAGNTENREEITKHKGTIAVISAMKHHIGDAAVQQEACALLLTLSIIKENGVSIGRHGGIHAILAAMKRHVKNSSVQSSACAALWNLSVSSANQTVIHKHSGINAIITGMKVHVSVSAVQQKACLALANMAVTEAYRTAIIKLGGIAATTDSMKCHVKDAQIQKYACKFLVAMLQSDVSKREIAKGASAVRVALQYHSGNADVKKYAQKVLVAVSFEDDNTGVKRMPMITSVEV